MTKPDTTQNISTTEHAPSNGAFHDKSDQFYLSEYACLRKEVELVLKDYRSLERYVIVAVGVTWGWLFEKHTPAWTFITPCLFAVLGAIRALGIMQAFGRFHDYLLLLEKAFWNKSAPPGWENYHGQQTGFSRGAYLFWCLLIAATIGMVIFRFWEPAAFLPAKP